MVVHMIEITSANNGYFKKAKSLHYKKYREKEELFLLEGYRYIKTAIELKQKCFGLFFTQDHQEFDQWGDNFPHFVLSKELFSQLSQTENTQGIIGIFSMPKTLTLEDTFEGNSLLYLDRIQDPGNLGTIIRTADAAGISTILLGKGCVDVYNDKTIRSAAGSILNVKFVYVSDSVKGMQKIREQGFKIIVTALENARYFDEPNLYGQKNCLVIGNEANGVSPEIINHSDVCVKIPIDGNAESLNAAVAAGIMMYKLREQGK